MQWRAATLARSVLSRSGPQSSRAAASTPTDRANDKDISFDNPRLAFATKTTSEIARAVFVFRLFSFNVLVDNNKKLMSVARRFLGERLFRGLMKSTVYGQFIAGENRESIKPVLDRYRQAGVRSILDYAVEEDVSDEGVMGPVQDDAAQVKENDFHRLPQFQAYKEFADRRMFTPSATSYFWEGEEKCTERLSIFLQAVEAAVSSENDGFVAIKLTALGQTSFLLHLSSILQQVRFIFDSMTDPNIPLLERRLTKEDFTAGLKKLGMDADPAVIDNIFPQMDTTTNDGAVDIIDFIYFFRPSETPYTQMFAKRDESGALWPLVDNFTRRQELQMRSVLNRLEVLAEAAQRRNVSLFVDAEQSYFQPAINRLTTKMMKKFNTEKPIIYNTYQCYLKDTYDLLQRDIELARRFGVCFGAKLVRGAYMEQERERAASVGYNDPIHEDYAATTHCYNSCMSLVMREVAERGAGLMVATHNEDTVRNAAACMEKYGLKEGHPRISFGQLLGMSDHVTFDLGRRGYRAYKYMPYGPVDEVLAYLSRRANENRGLLRGAKRERSLVQKELLHRLSFNALRAR